MKKVMISLVFLGMVFATPIYAQTTLTQDQLNQQMMQVLIQMINQLQQQIVQILASQNIQNDPNSANCVPKWQCSDWSQICKLIVNPNYTYRNNLQTKVFEQTRECIDLNKCLIVAEEDKPITVQIVNYCPSYLPE
jgi:hypothetical protein